MKKLISLITSIFFLAFFSSSAFSAGDEEAIKKLSSFKKTGIDVVADVIEQDTKFRRNIEKNILPNIKMPAGFKIEIFAVAPDARHMAVSRNKGTVWIGTRKTRVWQATDRDMDNIADTVEQYKDKDIPRPNHWGGFIVIPSSIEFWQGHDGRLHDRLKFEKENN